MRQPGLLAAQVWGTVCGGTLGAVRTREAAVHLLAKGRALEALGIPALPGTGHWDTLASWAPAAAGALFFGLSLGLGTGTLLGLWAEAARASPGRLGRWLPWAALAAPLWAVRVGDLGLAACLLAAAAGAAVLVSLRPPSRPRALAARLGLAAVVLLGLVPWAFTSDGALDPTGAFSRLRDRYLLSNPAGRAVDHLYYAWTLYPAEALKPPAARTQPTAAVPAGARERFCERAWRLGILCLPPGLEGADLRVTAEGARLFLVDDRARVDWPSRSAAQADAWRAFSRASDRSRPLRLATAVGLFAGCPLALAWALGSLAGGAGRRILGLSAAGPWVCAAALAVAFALAGAPSPRPPPPETLGELGHDLGRDNAAARFRAVRAAADLGSAAAPLLIQALSDPVINVRYGAAQALGATGGPRARSALEAVLRSPDAWYVKDRAYFALRRLGWQPR